MLQFRYLKSRYPSILILGAVSFFTDVASEMLYPLTPILMTSVLGASMLNVGIVEGIAEGTSSLLKTYSGFWSDRIQSRKPFMVTGYLISALSRPLIGFSSSFFQVMIARSMDRIGKGIRGAPRDALISDIVPASDRGLAFGWHRSMDTLGAVVGPLLAILFLLFVPDIRYAFFLAIIPGLISVALILFISEPEQVKRSSVRPSFHWEKVSREYKKFLIGWFVFCLCNSSDAFLIMKMKSANLSLTIILLVFAFFNLVYALFSPSLGALSDKFGSRKVILFGMVIYFLSYLCFAIFDTLPGFVFAFALYGAYMAATEGVSKAYTVNLVDTDTKGTALGILGTVTGLAQIIASVLAGYLWDHVGMQWAFWLGCFGSLFFFCWILFTKQKINS